MKNEKQIFNLICRKNILECLRCEFLVAAFFCKWKSTSSKKTKNILNFKQIPHNKCLLNTQYFK